MLNPQWEEVLDHTDALLGVVELIEEGPVFVLANRRSEELFGSPPSLPPLQRQLWAKHCERCAKDSIQLRFEFAWPGKAGDQWFCVTLSPTAVDRFCYVAWDVTQQKQAQAHLRSSNEQLALGINQLKERGRELTLLGELGRALANCQTLEQAHRALRGSLPLLFDSLSGSLGTIEAGLVERVVRWGPLAHCGDSFAAAECRAIQTLKIQWQNAGTLNPCHRCASASSASLCLPLVADAKVVGVLSLTEQIAGQLHPARRALAAATVEQLALALAHLKLRCTLRAENVRDPLTGLFNRRYLEEFFEQHMGSEGGRLGLAMLDVDHFKSFNDRWGHEAGDAVLREIALLLKGLVRQGDAVCRFGGEEFVLVLPGADLEATRERAEQIRSAVEHLQFQPRNGAIEPITISAGVSAAHEPQTSSLALFLAADEALYEAKKQGRNRVVAAPMPGEVAQPECQKLIP